MLASLSVTVLYHADLFLSLGLTTLISILIRQFRFRLEMLFPAWSLRLLLQYFSLWIVLLALNIIFRNNLLPISPDLSFLWFLDAEISTFSVVTTIPLFLAGMLCLVHILPSGKLSRVEWLIWFALCLGFTLMALVEFQILPKSLFGFRGRELLSAAAGLFVALPLFMILRCNTTARRLTVTTILCGLAVAAVGAVIVDNSPVRGNQYVFHFGALEETLEVTGALVALAGVAGYAASVAPGMPAQRTVKATVVLLVVLLVGAMVHYRYSIYIPTEESGPGARNVLNISRTLLEEYLYARRIEVNIDDTLTLTGWQYDPLQPGAATTLRLWLHAIRQPGYPFGLSVQLLDQESGSILAQVDKMSWDGVEDGDEKGKWSPGRPLTRIQAVTLELPADVPSNHAITLSLSAWEYSGQSALRPLPVRHSDHPLLGNSHIILDEFVLPLQSEQASQTEALATFANGFLLNEASFPEQTRAGDELNVTFNWGAESAGSEDYIQYLHFFHDDSGAYWTIDQMPLGLRLPTRLWYEGLRSSEAWRFTLPADLQPGQYSIYSGLYRLSDMQRLSVTLVDGTQPADARIPLGTILIEG